MREDSERRAPLLRVVLIFLLLLLCTSVTYYFHFVLGIEVIYTHFFYVPIVLAGIWWGTKGLFAPVFLAIIFLVSHSISEVEHPLTGDLIRGAMFIFVGWVVGILIEGRNRLQREVLLEMEKAAKIEQMENHAKYVEKVAHELRNPLQVLMGILDTVEFGKLTAEEKKLVDMLNNTADEIGKKIEELTRREED